MDVDETIIDNSPFNVGLIGKDYGYSGDTWKAAVYGGGKWYKKSSQEKSEIRINTLKKV